MKKILSILLLINSVSFGQTLLKLKAIEYAPGSNYCIVTNSLGIQTYTPCSSLSSTVIPTLQQVVTSGNILNDGQICISTNSLSTINFSDDQIDFNTINTSDSCSILLNSTIGLITNNQIIAQATNGFYSYANFYLPNTTANKILYLNNSNKVTDLTLGSGLSLSSGTLTATGTGSTTILTASTNITISGSAPNYTISTPTQTTGLASLTGAETLTNKRITVRTNTTTTTATISVNSDSYDLVAVTSLSTATTFTAPTGTPTEGQGLIYRIKDNGTARTLTFNSSFRFSSDVPAPTTTIVSKWMYLFFVYNLTDAKWDCLTIATNY